MAGAGSFFQGAAGEHQGQDLTTYGFLGYPSADVSDIMVYKADVVPVGEDQVAHVELTREITRRFNGFYGASKAEVFPEPNRCRLPPRSCRGSTDEDVESYGNTTMSTDPEPTVRQKLKTMVTDPARVRRTDPGNPDVCPVGDLHKIFSARARWPR